MTAARIIIPDCIYLLYFSHETSSIMQAQLARRSGAQTVLLATCYLLQAPCNLLLTVAVRSPQSPCPALAFPSFTLSSTLSFDFCLFVLLQFSSRAPASCAPPASAAPAAPPKIPLFPLNCLLNKLLLLNLVLQLILLLLQLLLPLLF